MFLIECVLSPLLYLKHSMSYSPKCILLFFFTEPYDLQTLLYQSISTSSFFLSHVESSRVCLSQHWFHFGVFPVSSYKQETPLCIISHEHRHPTCRKNSQKQDCWVLSETENSTRGFHRTNCNEGIDVRDVSGVGEPTNVCRAYLSPSAGVTTAKLVPSTLIYCFAVLQLRSLTRVSLGQNRDIGRAAVLLEALGGIHFLALPSF